MRMAMSVPQAAAVITSEPHQSVSKNNKHMDETSSVESGYGSAASLSPISTVQLPRISLTTGHIHYLNRQLEVMDPLDILRFVQTLFPSLYQATAFGLTGLATIHMLSKLEEMKAQESNYGRGVELIFLDTLYHFPETYDLVKRVQARYPSLIVHTFKPKGFDTVTDFEAIYGRLYETSEEMYDYLAKVEPQERAYNQLNVVAVLTGRRRSQGGQRGQIDIIEVDEERGIFKINPLANWSFNQVQAYIREHNVPYNELLDCGYMSIGDWHSTSPVQKGEDERAGRWKGRDKTECGIHNKQSRYAQYLALKQIAPAPEA